jgi:hypothetical protein
MVTITYSTVETEIIKVLEDLNTNLNIGATITSSLCPGNEGFASQALLTIMSTLEINLNIIIPHNIYIFYDKDKNKQLSIAEATKKLIKEAENGK